MKELDYISSVKKISSSLAPFLETGIGDDCAVFGESQVKKWLITTDLLVENVHFLFHAHPPYELGRKSLSVNLSDIAAMGGEPSFILLSVAFTKKTTKSWIAAFNKGIDSILTEFNCTLIGGDTTSSDKLAINVVALGSMEHENVVYRNGASVGDDIYISGPLGHSAAGLTILQNNLTVGQEYNHLIRSHLDPIPQISLGKFLSSQKLVTSMQDLSDGVATDLGHICKASNVSAEIYQDKLPIDKHFELFCRTYNLDMYKTMLCGGEDYHLIFTADKKNRDRIAQQYEKYSYPVRIGKVTSGSGVFLIDDAGKRKNITFSGFEHTF